MVPIHTGPPREAIKSSVIHTGAIALDNSVKKATTDTRATGAFSDADGNDILASVEALGPTTVHALNGIVADKAAFEALPTGDIPALILQDLKNLSTDTGAFADALIDKYPADLVPRAKELKAKIAAAYAAAIAAYSS